MKFIGIYLNKLDILLFFYTFIVFDLHMLVEPWMHDANVMIMLFIVVFNLMQVNMTWYLREVSYSIFSARETYKLGWEFCLAVKNS